MSPGCQIEASKTIAAQRICTTLKENINNSFECIEVRLLGMICNRT